MSWYTDGVDDGKREKFDELMVEIVALREQLAVAGKAVMVLSKTVQMQGEQLATISKILHYPNCWDTAAYPDLESCIAEIFGLCTTCEIKEEGK